MPDLIEHIEALVRRFADGEDHMAEVPTISLAQAIRDGDDPFHVLPYMAELGKPVASLDDLLAINDDETEEELAAFRVVEGVAISVASDARWLLFVP